MDSSHREVKWIDLVDKIWSFNGHLEKVNGEKAEENDPKPKVTKYILMSVKDAYTDFHLDFAGTSVYYNVISGQKKFLLFPPTQSNIDKYIEWSLKEDQNSVFLGDILEDGIAMELDAGDLFMIPAGYIHAVYTPVDSLVFGGNFLTIRDLETHLKIVEIEKLTKVPRRFTFPKFDRSTVRELTSPKTFEAFKYFLTSSSSLLVSSTNLACKAGLRMKRSALSIWSCLITSIMS